jgi:hypothetical protein
MKFIAMLSASLELSNLQVYLQNQNPKPNLITCLQEQGHTVGLWGNIAVNFEFTCVTR